METRTIGQKIRVFYNTWLAPGYGTGADNPRPAALGTVLLGFFDWSFFYVLIPYESIPNKELFWLGFLVWFMPTATTAWFVRSMPRDKANRAYGAIFGVLGVTIVFVFVASQRNEAWDPILFASWPGIINGAGLGIDTDLILKFWRRGD